MDTDSSPRSVISGVSTSNIIAPRSPTRSERKGKRLAPPPPPPHLSEFITYVNGKNSSINNGNQEIYDTSKNETKDVSTKPRDRKKRTDITSWSIHSNMSNPSLSSMNSMTPTIMDLDVLVTKKDVSESIEQMQELKFTCDNLSNKLKEVSEAFGDFGAIIEKISRSKGSGEYCNALSTFSNYQYLVSNQHRYLGELLQREFAEQLDSIRKEYEEKNQIRRDEFQNEYKKLVRELKNSEVANSKLRKGKIRNLVSYKSNLVNLTNKLENIDHVYHDYYVDSFNMLENVSGKIVEHAKNVVYQESVVFGKLAEKTQPGNGLDILLTQDGEEYDEGDDTIHEPEIENHVTNDEIILKGIIDENILSIPKNEEANEETNEEGSNDRKETNVMKHRQDDDEEEEEEEDTSKRDERYMQKAVSMLHSAIDDSDDDLNTSSV
ncbi:hypothetical protein C6P40_005447 [Pichia californica]|uniref:Protein IVY1 n=1 Tax=Pichia californica TaxID=460514 RepID=A0A9P7BGG5_9ASCO|nr:hypothetical protein C6P40_005447 [[Candida] californica]